MSCTNLSATSGCSPRLPGSGKNAGPSYPQGLALGEADVAGTVRQLRDRVARGGRLCIVDLEATPNVRRFHKPGQTIPEHYEYDGFDRAAVVGWFFAAGGFGEVEFVRRPTVKPLHADWGGKEGAVVAYTLFYASATKM